jgi:4-hydroxy-4-methyl-2-oxoglutarate aldolase
MNKINTKITRLSKSVIKAAKGISSATLHEAYQKKGAVNNVIKCISAGTVLCGSAVTISCTPGDNLGLHVAIALSKPGDVLVATVNNYPEFGYWGEIMAVAAIVKGISGLVIDGCVRDFAELRRLRFPAFASGLCVKGTNKKSFHSINHPITLGTILINPGDLILGDDDGLVVIAQDRVPEVIKMAILRQKKEEWIIENLKNGRTTLELLGLDKEWSRIKSICNT